MTWGEIQIIALQKMFAKDEPIKVENLNTLRNDDDCKWYLSAMPAVANEAIQQLAQNFAKQIVKRLPKYALTKTVIYPIVKQVAKWIGVKLTKESFAKGLGKVVPLLGGVISGGLTYITFRPGAKKLKKTLHECCVFLKQNASKEKDGEFTSYEEVNLS